MLLPALPFHLTPRHMPHLFTHTAIAYARACAHMHTSSQVVLCENVNIVGNKKLRMTDVVQSKSDSLIMSPVTTEKDREKRSEEQREC